METSVSNLKQTIISIENSLMKLPQQKGLKVEEHFIDGLYVRHLFIPKDTILTGAMHKGACINILASGVIAVATTDDSEITPMKGCHIFPADGGIKRIGVTYSDVHWITAHKTEAQSKDAAFNDLFDCGSILEDLS